MTGEGDGSPAAVAVYTVHHDHVGVLGVLAVGAVDICGRFLGAGIGRVARILYLQHVEILVGYGLLVDNHGRLISDPCIHYHQNGFTSGKGSAALGAPILLDLIVCMGRAERHGLTTRNRDETCAVILLNLADGCALLLQAEAIPRA